MYLNEIRGEVSQGDVFDSLPLAYVTQESAYQVHSENARAIILTYDCGYDKPSTRFVMVTGVFPLTGVPADRQGNIRRNKIFSTFYLSANTRFDESYVDFRYMGRLDKRLVADQAQANTRLISLDDEAQLALQEQLSAFFGDGRGR